MKRFGIIVLAAGTLLFAQFPPHPVTERPKEPEERRLPNGKLQQDEILKAEHQKSLEEVAKLIKLAEDLQSELEKNDRHILSISSLKKAEEIEKLAKRLRERIRK